jgi:hypothetical protein
VKTSLLHFNAEVTVRTHLHMLVTACRKGDRRKGKE